MIGSSSKASKHIFIGNLLIKGLNFIGSIALARLLAKEDFGYWVLITIITSFVTLVFDVGFETYYLVKVKLIGEDKMDDNEINSLENTIFFLKLFMSIFLFAAQFSVSYLLDGFYFDAENSPIDEIIRILSFTYLIVPFGVINEIRFKKRQLYTPVVKSQIFSEASNLIIKIGLAFIGFGVFSIAYGMLAKRIVKSIYLVFQGKFIPQFSKVKKSYFKGIFGFAKYTWISGTIGFFSQQMDKLFLAKTFSVSQIGSYNFANATANMPYNYFVMPQASLVLSYISNFQDDKGKLSESFTKIIRLTVLLMLPILFIGYFYVELLIRLIYGEKWVSSASLMQVFLILVAVRMFVFPFMPGLTAIGRIKQNTMIVLARTITVGLCLLILTGLDSFSLLSFVKIYVGINIIFDFLKAFISSYYLKISLLKILKDLSKKTIYIALLLILIANKNIVEGIFFEIIIMSIFIGIYAFVIKKYLFKDLKQLLLKK
ncbi:oligosaccharide flippase family protein [Aureivirga marina]|uniref:oligosaccharide flippase family protein n=1 Tax=Aureivirga marina TaxID=1182451 RepID=UPI0018C92471|nr:oligosaccharide flippase family protein [Aureivirga marina]